MSNIDKVEVTDQDFTVDEICKITGLTKSRIYADIDSGKLKAYRKRNKYYVKKEDIDMYKERAKEVNNSVIGICFFVLLMIIIIPLLFMLFR